ncbi:protein draper isoform X2 [Acyrthosiphon pisum]|uniref:EGF-like domain-containing protein n=1 Tax=Acyrthosiphon pisum TaxID=7029 RepID=A0A8R2H843_ACYPI|nr:protein draper isoform X2 [Acyrthosiphon pisum]|eukprot:XP_016661742.1 PREDICTED: cell death abnormality protein 1 isoform X2 [Acyrthosiphon pisum]
MDGRFILVTGVVVFGLCGPCLVSSTTSISNGSSIETFTGHSIDNLMEFVTKKPKFVNETIDFVPNNFTDFVLNHNFTDVINNTTTFIIGNFTKFTIDNTTKLIFENSTGPKLTGPFVCTVIKNYKSKKITTNYEIRSFKTPYFCFNNWKLICYIVNETAVPIQTETSENNLILTNTCCNGYEKTPNEAKCRPVCKDPCVWGTCISPNVCSCDEYYDGPTCRIRIGCPLGKFGFDCTQTCQCQNNATCNYLNGNCSCQQGYWGKYCEDPCPPGYYGHKCQNVCKCQTGAKCDPVNGACNCSPGYTGTNCEVQCPPGFYGYKCQSECKYQNGTKCDIFNGNCTCLPGSEEHDAELNECNCQNGTLCGSVNETCSCQPEHAGNNCKFTCPPGYYGKSCQNPCKCQNGGKCNAVNGDCACSPGFTGEYCSLTCPSGFYGYQCQYECKCQSGALCDPVIGVCVSESGLTDKDCEKVCPPGTYGVDCNSTCRCQNESKCRVTDGVCLCEPGFSGPTCSEACPKNYYGEMCMHKCMCDVTTEICNHIEGCVACNSSFSNDSECIDALQLDPINNETVWISDILVILSFLIMSTICMAVMMCCYYYYNQRQIQKCNLGHVNNFELRKSTSIESNPNIEVICTTSNCGMNIENGMVDSRKTMIGYTNTTFYNNYSYDNSVDDDTGENLYLEIDESTLKRADLYDRLDFLRPTVSWKPHYQSAFVLQDQAGGSKKEETT